MSAFIRFPRLIIFLLIYLGMVSPLPAEETPPAPLLAGMGSYHFPVTTENSQTRRYFDQGLVLAFAFNHAEAARSLREAVRLDPQCAMCYWGWALVLGPNINAGMEDAAVAEAYEAIQKASELAGSATEKEQALIRALAKRYAPAPVKDRKALDIAYADAMREVALKFPEDADVLALLAEALMDLHPWDFWTLKEKKAQPWTAEILQVLLAALKHNPEHPLANHLYIHAIEASAHPEKGIPAADRLRTLVPGAGHLVHMSSHIYINVGRYRDAAIANQRAIEADQNYLKQVKAQGLYPLGYVPHNYHFLWAAAMMEGQSALAIEAAKGTAEAVDQTMMREPDLAGTLQHFYTMPLYALARFGKWEEILAAPSPPEDLKYPKGIWHFARGMAQNAEGQVDEAKQELEQLKSIANDPALSEMKVFGLNSFKALLQISVEMLEGEIAASQKDYDKAVDHLQAAVRIEDALIYNEPADWYFPPRQALGAVLLEAGRGAEAEQVYREDLQENPNNGWSLFGLAQSLRAQDKTEELSEVDKQFQKAWNKADIELTGSRF